MTTMHAIPMRFEHYLERFDEVELQECTGCLDGPAMHTDGTNVYCLQCLRHMHGYDRAEWKMTLGVVAGLLDAEVAPEAIHAAVEHALANEPE